MNIPTGELLFDHYVQFLGEPVANDIYHAHGFASSIQLLKFKGVFSECTTFATLGFGRHHFAYSGKFVEIVMVVDKFEQEAKKFLIDTLFVLLQKKIPIQEGISIGGTKGVPNMEDKTSIKKALYFAEPIPFPLAFRFFNSEARVLLVLPITSSEHEFVKSSGASAFETYLELSGLDPFIIDRISVC